MRDGACNGGVDQRYVAAQDIGHGLAAAFVGNVHQIGAGFLAQEFASNVGCTASA